MNLLRKFCMPHPSRLRRATFPTKEGLFLLRLDYGNNDGIQYIYSEKVLIYEYSAWGQVLYTNSADIPLSLNPLRYRGYVYDVETELYYLQSRYYDPQMGRFLNVDDYPKPKESSSTANSSLYHRLWLKERLHDR